VRLELSLLVSAKGLLVWPGVCKPSYVAVLLAQAESHTLVGEGSGQMSRLNEALPLLCLDHVEGLGCDGLEEHNLSSVPICCQPLLEVAVSCHLLPELEETEVELVSS
jgi:hypothetical protein